ncbi:hypothetical protein I7I53_00903 [Histoplasma capsulatum var. duboisii H88]|uniref:Uncharacterized protein n=1 Tax=Ajellomyces capsulatus (strain H88) TaxID=544711 RepID=A0A8A1LI94_AJEC8|nr:hypothetical protein I7I53_00903 [Histoplasma capsulatum var. duboisii H88]
MKKKMRAQIRNTTRENHIYTSHELNQPFAKVLNQAKPRWKRKRETEKKRAEIKRLHRFPSWPNWERSVRGESLRAVAAVEDLSN